MFLTLLPSLIREAPEISLFVEKRLRTIYARSFPQINVVNDKYLASVSHSPPYDYQVPLGSICQHRFTSFDKYGCELPSLLSIKLYNLFRERHYDGRPLVGISWRGGGSPKILVRRRCLLNYGSQFI